MMNSEDIMSFIKNKQHCILFILDSNHFSSKLLKLRVNNLQVDEPFRFVELDSIKYYAQYYDLVVVPSVLFFKNGNLVGKVRGILSSEDLQQKIKFYKEK